MEYIQIAGIGIVGAITAVTIRNWRPELAIITALVTGIVIIFTCVGPISDIFSEIQALVYECGIETGYIKIVIKLIGIAYISKFAGNVCRDCGESAIAVKTELAGKVAIFAITIPLVRDFLNLVITNLNTF